MSFSSESSALTAEGTAEYRDRVEEAATVVRDASAETPTVGLLSDVDLGRVLGDDPVESAIPCTELPHYPGSEGTVRIGTLDGRRVVAAPQSLHLYDGDTPRDVAFPVRMLALAGVEALLLPARARAVNPQFEPGDLMLVTDHINFQGLNPLVGPNVDAWGPRFPDMTEPYDSQMRQIAADVARAQGTSLQKGVLLGLLGPRPETAAERRMARRLGADAVGMSVVPEVLVARHMDVSVLAVVELTGLDRGEAAGPPVAADGRGDARRERSEVARLLRGIIGRLGPDSTA